MIKSLLFICFYIIGLAKAQVPTVQDCLGAMPVCKTSYTMEWNFEGEGNIPNEVNSNTSCLGAGERNSLWLKIHIAESGLLGFNIIPNVNQVDFDWAVFNLTNHQCSDIFSNPSLEVSCNYSGSYFPTSITGANGGTNTDTSYPNYPFYPQEEPMIPVVAGETYYFVIATFQQNLIINNFTIDFSLGTCEIGGCSKLSGSLYLDENKNCVKDQNETGVVNMPLRLFNQESSYFANTDSIGNYTFNFYSGGEIQLEILPSNSLFL
jgi:hypothetical protein